VELSNSLKYINLAGVVIGLVPFRGPMDLGGCVTEKRGDGEGAGSLTGRVIGLVALRGPMHLCVCVIKEGGDGKGAVSQSLSDTFRYINLAGLTTGLVTLRGPMHLFSCVSLATIFFSLPGTISNRYAGRYEKYCRGKREGEE
jgi:hypothetical protein